MAFFSLKISTSSHFCYFSVFILYWEVILEGSHFFICSKTAFQKGAALRHSRPPPKPKSRWMPRKAHSEGGRSVVPWLLSDLKRNTCTHYEKIHPASQHRPRALTCTQTSWRKSFGHHQLCGCAFRTNDQGSTQQSKCPQLPDLGGGAQQLISGRWRSQQPGLVPR